MFMSWQLNNWLITTRMFNLKYFLRCKIIINFEKQNYLKNHILFKKVVNHEYLKFNDISKLYYFTNFFYFYETATNFFFLLN